MLPHDAARARPDAARRDHVFTFALGQHPRPHQAGKGRHGGKRQGIRHADWSAAQDRDNTDTEQDGRERQQRVIEAHQDRIDPATEVAGRQATGNPKASAQSDRDHADQE